jgi:hypothetical protein
MNYENLKKWIENNRQKIYYAGCCVIIFVLGFGTGRFDRKLIAKNQTSTKSNYTTKSTEKPVDNTEKKTKATANPVTEEPAVTATQDKSKLENKTTSGECKIKGNISANSKIYHVKGGSFYERVKPEQCFNTEAEAKAAGFRKSGR